MVRYELYPEHETKAIVRLRLQKDPNGEIALHAVDHNGHMVPGGCLLFFRLEGTIGRPSGIDPNLGFKRDPAGRIEVK